LWWLSSIVSAIELRKVAGLLFSKGYSVEDVDNLLVLGTGEAALIKEHFDKFGTIDIDSIVKTLQDLCRKRTLEYTIERMINKNYDINDIIDVIKQYEQ
jgi:hypothetical protein